MVDVLCADACRFVEVSLCTDFLMLTRTQTHAHTHNAHTHGNTHTRTNTNTNKHIHITYVYRLVQDIISGLPTGLPSETYSYVSAVLS